MNSESKLFGISIDPRLLKAAFKKTEHETTVAQNVDGEGDHDILAVYPLRDNLCDLCSYDRQLLSWRRKLAACFLPLLHPLRVCLALGGSNATHTRHSYCKNQSRKCFLSRFIFHSCVGTDSRLLFIRKRWQFPNSLREIKHGQLLIRQLCR